jgi:hypothetical protein
MKKTGSEIPPATEGPSSDGEGPGEPIERARLQADVAGQRLRLAKEELRRARKRLKEAKREAKRARKHAASVHKEWKRARKRAKKNGDVVDAAPGARKSKTKVAARRTVRATVRLGAKRKSAAASRSRAARK